MKAEILDERHEGEDRSCYLCRVSLKDYLEGLSSEYQDYDIQRGIVQNVYLDRLVETVLEKRHIPPIVLVVEDGNAKKRGSHLEIKAFKILDGLQRTYRLKAIYATVQYCIDNIDKDDSPLSMNKFAFSRRFSSDLKDIHSTTNVLRYILEVREEKGDRALRAAFSDNIQWFEIWTGLSDEDEVRKMLVLNAGHKPVKTRHQLELLFLNLLPMLRKQGGRAFNVVREKETAAAQFSKGRNTGDFHFAHIITALLSLFEGKAISASTTLIEAINDDEEAIEKYGALTTLRFLKEFVNFLLQLDELLDRQFGDVGIRWVGREVALAGIFGAIGRHADKVGKSRDMVMAEFIKTLKKNPKCLNLNKFEDVRNGLDLSQINIGNANRVAIFDATSELLEGKHLQGINWTKFFPGAGK